MNAQPCSFEQLQRVAQRCSYLFKCSTSLRYNAAIGCSTALSLAPVSARLGMILQQFIERSMLPCAQHTHVWIVHNTSLYTLAQRNCVVLRSSKLLLNNVQLFRMTTTKTKFNQSEAARIVGRVRNTIAAHLKSGKISGEQDSEGNLVIDKSELIRAYGDDCDFSRVEPSIESEEKTPSTSIGQGVHAQLSMTEQLLEAQKEERKRERERLEAEIDRLEQLLERSEERQNKITLLLEDRTRGIGEWEKMLTNLQRQVTSTR